MSDRAGHHILPVRLYLFVFGALMLFTATTIGVSFVNLGPLNTVVALGIAAIKATLVILFFMHVRYSSRLIWLFSVVGFLWLAILITLTASDFLTRYPA